MLSVAAVNRQRSNTIANGELGHTGTDHVDIAHDVVARGDRKFRQERPISHARRSFSTICKTFDEPRLAAAILLHFIALLEFLAESPTEFQPVSAGACGQR